MTLLALLLAMLGFAALALAMARHARDLLGRAPTRAQARRLRISAAQALLMSYASVVTAWGVIIGSILAYAILSLAAAVVVLLLRYRSA